MATYPFQDIEQRWQQYWAENDTFRTGDDPAKPKYYILDMFPYPSGAGLHVGHPLGYVATGIIAHYKRLKGFNVLRPMGYDSFGLPAENYAIQTGTHPAITTERNIERYRGQMERLGLAYDPHTEVRTSDPDYYRWTQWIFLQLFGSWFNNKTNRAEPIDTLTAIFAQAGSAGASAACNDHDPFTAVQWNTWDAEHRERMLLNYRLAYLADTYVNWCEALGTVLANEEVKDGLSERGGHPVERRLMRQWCLRITAYAERLLNDLDGLDWPSSLIEMQRNWIGRSEGATLWFAAETDARKIEVFTTRPDTLFGVSFIVLAPEHPWVDELTTDERRAEVHEYVRYAQRRSERDRLAEAKHYTGAFTGAYALHPFTGTRLPIWIADYVLAGYGTGAIMAVPAHDGRDYAFARTFGLPIRPIIQGADVEHEAYEAKSGTLVNSQFLDGLSVPEATRRVIDELELQQLGRRRVNYRLRDAIFSRQRYWGEPFPIVYRDGLPRPVDASELPVTLPEVQSYKTTGTGQSPIAAITDWVERPDGSHRETDTMPGWAGSSWYFFRYISPRLETRFVDQEREKYWMPVDLYVGGAEHAVGHLLYSRFWTKVLYDLGEVSVQEPFKKLVNQGMIQGRSSIIYKRKDENVFDSWPLSRPADEYIPIHVDVNIVVNDVLDVEAYRQQTPVYRDATFNPNKDGQFVCEARVEKMSKSLLNVVNPDDVCARYGADSFRMYEMFMGPIEQHKPWDTNGVTGVHNFLRRTWSLYVDDEGKAKLSDETPAAEEMKILHQTLRKVGEDVERMSFNTAVSQFMICVNELTRLGCRKRAVLEPLAVCLAPFAPHLAEELWRILGHETSVFFVQWPEWKEEFLVENEFEYPVSVNGKLRFKHWLPLNLTAEQIEAETRGLESLAKYTDGKPIKKMIVVPGKIINVVV